MASTEGPTVRLNVVTGEWSVLSTARAKRPQELLESLLSAKRAAQHQRPDATSSAPGGAPGRPCPFCPGNEELDLEVSRDVPPPAPWRVRVVRNRFPAVQPFSAASPPGPPCLAVPSGVEPCVAGQGCHEVVVVTPVHSLAQQGLDTDEQAALVLRTLRDRSRAAARCGARHVCAFQNHGPRAGASLPHPHCQVLSLPVVPHVIESRVAAASRYHERTGRCALCDVVDSELAAPQRPRVVAVTERAVAWVPFAAVAPYQVWVAPRRHAASFALVDDDEDLAHVAALLRRVLRALHDGLGNPDLNYVVETAPVGTAADCPHLHWYINVVARTTVPAGLELGTGVCINPQLPETSAEVLRSFLPDGPAALC
eukprot:m51a1_g6413 hypothetical protein (369) ;mRNA; f:272747-273853